MHRYAATDILRSMSKYLSRKCPRALKVEVLATALEREDQTCPIMRTAVGESEIKSPPSLLSKTSSMSITEKGCAQ